MKMEQFSSFVNKTTDEMLGVKGLEQENLNDMFSSYTPRQPTPTQINAGDITYSYEESYPNNTVGKALNDFYEELNNKIDDVQVNGVSVVSDGVANVPTTRNNILGVCKPQAEYGIGANGNGDGGLRVEPATSNLIKIASGTGSLYKPIVPFRQHESTFYGLAKAAGDSTQSESLDTVGTYTDNAKSAIQIMLGIAGIVGNVEGATASQAYSVGDAFLYGGALYKATVSIATNDAIVPGTNCELTNLINLIKGV